MQTARKLTPQSDWQARAKTASHYITELWPKLSGKGGVVVLWEGKAQGWVNELRDPRSWQPGCIAVSVDSDRQWQAIGGNDYDGALVWEELTKPQ